MDVGFTSALAGSVVGGLTGAKTWLSHLEASTHSPHGEERLRCHAGDEKHRPIDERAQR